MYIERNRNKDQAVVETETQIVLELIVLEEEKRKCSKQRCNA